MSTSWKLSLTVFLQYRKNSFSALDSTLSRSKVRLHKTETGVRTQAQKFELSLIGTSWRRLLSKSLTLGRKTEGKKKKTFRFAFFFLSFFKSRPSKYVRKVIKTVNERISSMELIILHILKKDLTSNNSKEIGVPTHTI